MIRNIVGSPARGEDCYGRDAEVQIIWDKLNTGHVLLVAPRRFGKTSIMLRLHDEPRDGRKVIYTDLEHISDAEGFLIELISAVAERSELRKCLDKFGKMIGQAWSFLRDNIDDVGVGELKVKLRQESRLRQDWREKADELFACLNSCEENFVIMLDEFPTMIQHMLHRDHQAAVDFLHWFRRLRTDPTNKLQGIRFVIAGSINLQTTLDQFGLVATINDLAIVAVRPMRDELAPDFVKRLFAGRDVEVGSEHIDYILNLVGPPIPYFVQIMVDKIAEEHLYYSKPLTLELIDRVYRDSLLGTAAKTDFQHYYSRLKEYYPQDERAARELLKALAQAGSVPREALYTLYVNSVGNSADKDAFCRLLATLENDFYIVREDGTDEYCFLCPPLKDWWLRYYGF
jgi:uncharacterized protein